MCAPRRPLPYGGIAVVVISEVGGWPVGENLNDLIAYARAQGAEGYEVQEARLCACAACGGQIFGVHGDLEEHAAKRVCRGCGAEHFIADSGDYYLMDDANPAIMVCECDGGGDAEDFNVAVAYSLYADGEGVRAIAVTSRCVACGRLGYWDDWMVRSGDMHLLDPA
jgi:hypothetical protein